MKGIVIKKNKIKFWRGIKEYIKSQLGISLGRFHSFKEYPLACLSRIEEKDASHLKLKFSIVTPSYNQGRFISETIESVLNQGYPLFEYIIQDALSTDETKDVVGAFRDNRLRAFFERDEGQSDAINRGFRRSSGDIMCYLNSDDIMLPGTLQHVASIFDVRPDVDVIYADRFIIDEDSRVVGDWRLPPHDRSVIRIVDYIPQETLFWRRPLWEKVGGMDAALHFAMDWDLILRFESAGAKFIHVPEFLGAFRVHQQQKTQEKIKLGKKEMALIRRRYTGIMKRAVFQISRLRYLMLHRKINKKPIL